MRNTFTKFIAIFALATSSLQAQEYNRSSMSVLYTTYNDSYNEALTQYAEKFSPSGRYDVNVIPTKTIPIQRSRTVYKTNTKGEKMYYAPSIDEEVGKYASQIAQEIILHEFCYDELGYMDYTKVGERGLYNGVDEDVVKAKASKLGLNVLQDAGEALLSNSYFVVTDVTNIRSTYNDDQKKLWVATPQTHLYHIQWNDTIRDYFYANCWIEESDSSEVKDEKLALFRAMKIPVERIMSSSGREEAMLVEEYVPGKDKPSRQELSERALNALLRSSATPTLSTFEEEYETFQVSSDIASVHPIRIKIGTKEGVRTNDRFYVYETVSRDGSTTNTKEVRRGVILASENVTNNEQVATGESPSTVFYQIAGRKLHEGMVLREKRWVGIGVDFGYKAGTNSGVNIALSGSSVKRKFCNSIYGIAMTIDPGLSAGREIDYVATNFALNYGYGLRCNNMELYPYFGVGMDLVSPAEEEGFSEDETKDMSAWFASVGARLNVNVYHPVALFVGGEFNAVFSQKASYGYMQEMTGRNINGLSFFTGVRISF